MRCSIAPRGTVLRPEGSSRRWRITLSCASWWTTFSRRGLRRQCRERCGRLWMPVDAVASFKKDEVSLGELAAKLSLDKSATSRRLRDATDRGYWVNLETRRGRSARIIIGDPMPE